MNESYGACDDCNREFNFNEKIIRIKIDNIGDIFKLTFCNNECCNKSLTKYPFLLKYDNYESTSDKIKISESMNIIELFDLFPEYLLVNGMIKKAQEIIQLLILFHHQEVYLKGKDKEFFEYCKNNEIYLN